MESSYQISQANNPKQCTMYFEWIEITSLLIMLWWSCQQHDITQMIECECDIIYFVEDAFGDFRLQ